MKNSFDIADLIVKEIKGLISIEEQIRLDNWVQAAPANRSIYNKAKDPKQQVSKLDVYKLFNPDKVWSRIDNELFKTKTINFIPRKVMRYAAAIIFPLLIAGGGWLYFNNLTKNTSIAQIDTLIKPGVQKATLVLSNGGSVELDNEKPFEIIKEGETHISNEDNVLSYSSETMQNASTEILYNELVTPRGGSYNLKLADGTSVWLNAGSTLKFPVAFTDSTRQVFLHGEAYFEVSHNGKPFIVNSGTMDVRVLGTSFNVSAYADDTEITTTLVEGKIKIDLRPEGENKVISQILTPNIQAVCNKVESEINIATVNTKQFTSWMNGKLEFRNEPLDVVMKRLARWYDFTYEFENIEAKNFHFSARINNKENLSSILEMLEMTTEVKFALNKNTIVIQ